MVERVGEYVVHGLVHGLVHGRALTHIMPKRLREPLVILLEEAAGPVRWLRATTTRDEKNKRDCFCIGMYAGSPDEETSVPVHLSGRRQISLRISDGNYEESGMERGEYSRMRILQAVRQLAGMDHMYITISHIIC